MVGNTPMAMRFSLGEPGDRPRYAPGHRKNAFLPQAGFALEHRKGLQWQDRTGTTPGGHLPSTKEPWWEHPRETFAGSAAGRKLCLRPGSRAMSAPHRPVLAAKAIC